MRVGIEASYLLEPRKSGVETYTLNLVRALLALEERPEVFLYAARRQPWSAEAGELFGRADAARLTRLVRLWLRLRLPVAMWRDRVQVAHFPGTILPAWLPCPAVTTFYDLAAYRYPELYDPAELALYRRVVPAAARRSAAVIAVSQHTKRDLVRFLGVPEDKVRVTPLGVSEIFAPVAGAGEIVAQRYGIEGRYVLACVGSGHPRKNLRAVVKAFERLEMLDVRLVVVGAAERDPGAWAAIQQSPARESIALLGHVPEEELPALYSAAAVFCFPSLYEGFGLPVLEAMACGTPVVCGNTSSLPEVAGEAAVLVEPTDVEAIAGGLKELLADEGRRLALAAAGLARAKNFTWRRTAEMTVQVYQGIAR